MQNELSRVVDALPGQVWTALPGGDIDFANRGWRDYAGSDADAASGDGWQAIVHPDDLPSLLENWRRMSALGVAGELETRLRRFDGEYRWFAIRFSPMFDPSGRLARWCGVNVDIEDVKRSERAARAREDDMRAIVDSIPACIAVMTSEGDAEYVNRQNLEYMGASFEELKQWSTSGAVHPEDLSSVIAAWTHSVQTGEPYDIEHRIRRADGAYHWFHVRGLPLRDGAGRILRWCVVSTDIEDHKRDQALIGQALDEVRRSEDRLRTTIDAMPGFVWSAEPDGTVDFFNQRWCEYTGIRMQDAFGTCWRLTIHPDDAEQLRTCWQSLLETGEPGEAEARLRRRDGIYRWFLIRMVPLRDEAGRIVKWYGQNTDIDDRKRDEMLLAGEKRVLGMMAGGLPLAPILEALCALVENTLDGSVCSIVLVDPRRVRHLRDVTPLLRLQPGAAPNLPADLLSGLDGRSVDAEFDPVATVVKRSAAVIVPDLAAETRWKIWRPVALSHGFRANWSTPIPSTGGTLLGVISLLYPEPESPSISHCNLVARFVQLASIAIERARGESALKQSEAFLAKAQQVSQTGTFSWHVATDEITWSEEIYRIYELDPGITPTFDLIDARLHPDDMQSHHETIARQRGEGTDFEHEHRLLMPDGSVKYVHLVAHATRDENGELMYIAAVQDVTQRRLSQETLDKVRSELTHVARVATLGAVTASIAHEVNQPLSGIITNASTCLRMLAAEPPNLDGARETARRTIRDGNRASDVIKRLRALFSRKEATTERVDLNEAAREVVAMLLGELQRHGIALHHEFDDELPPVVGDRVQLQQVILNLLANASDALRDVAGRSRRIVIRTNRHEGGRVLLTVRDNGVGFDPQDADRLFNAFHTTKRDGMGIGLSISRSIIENHEGRLWVEANAGPGASFSFSIPCPHDHAIDTGAAGVVHANAAADPDSVVERA